MRLVMLDVDGTLVIGNGIDDICYSEAVKEVLGIGQIDADWSHYSNVTDSGITSEIIEKNITIKTHEHDILAVRYSYLARLRSETEKIPVAFRPLQGL